MVLRRDTLILFLGRAKEDEGERMRQGLGYHTGWTTENQVSTFQMLLFWRAHSSILISLASHCGQWGAQKCGSLPKAPWPTASPLLLPTLLGPEENGIWSWKKDGGWEGPKRPYWKELLPTSTSGVQGWLTEDQWG